MNETALAQIGALKLVSLPRGSSTGWDPTGAKLGLRELRRLRGEMAGLEAALVGVLKVETGRDTKAALARGFGCLRLRRVRLSRSPMSLPAFPAPLMRWPTAK